MMVGDFSWPLALYDAVAVLAPGFALPALLGLLHPATLRFYSWSTLPIIVVTFVAGHIVQGVAKVTYRAVDKLWRPQDFLGSASLELKTQLVLGVKRFYGVDFGEATLKRHQKDFCYSPVWNRMDNYRVFVALADFNRGFGCLALLAVAEFVAIGMRVVRGPVNPGVAFCIAGGAALLFWLFTDRSRFFRKLADGVLYHSFLSFVAERGS